MLGTNVDANATMANAIPAKSKPNANLPGLEGFLRPSFTHIPAKTGASRTTNVGWTDWYQLDGNENPKRFRRVSRSAKSVKLVAACSNDIQKITENTKRIKMTPTLKTSSRFSLRIVPRM